MPAPKDNQYAKGCETSGRPSKYKPEYCEMLLDHMEGGLSFRSFAGAVRVNFDTVYEWAKKHEEFSDAKRQGEALEELFLEKTGRAGMLGKLKGFNPATYIFTRKNKSGWSDKTEVKQEIKDINVNIKEWEK